MANTPCNDVTNAYALVSKPLIHQEEVAAVLQTTAATLQ